MEKKKISAKIVADSVNPQGNRITTFVLTYPRMIHSELMTHRMFSRNAASSRAIPFEKMVKSIEEDPFIPIAWQKDHKGMQGIEYITDPVKIEDCVGTWLLARNKAIREAKDLNNLHGVTKQLCNRLLEPFQWYTCLVTATEYDNFYELRCPKFINEHEDGEDISFSRKDFIKKLQQRYPTNWESDLKDFNGIENDTNEEWFSLSESSAEIHIQALAEAMWDAQNESIPKQLKPGEWHIPFGDNINDGDFTKFKMELWENKQTPTDGHTNLMLKIATARAARLSYITFDGKIDYEKDFKLYEQLLAPPFHASPFEHCARAMNDEEYILFHKGKLNIPIISEDGWIDLKPETHGWCNNFRGFIPYRYLIENE